MSFDSLKHMNPRSSKTLAGVAEAFLSSLPPTKPARPTDNPKVAPLWASVKVWKALLLCNLRRSLQKCARARAHTHAHFKLGVVSNNHGQRGAPPPPSSSLALLCSGARSSCHRLASQQLWPLPDCGM